VALWIAITDARTTERRRKENLVTAKRQWELDLTLRLSALIEKDLRESSGYQWSKWPSSARWQSGDARAIVSAIRGLGHQRWMGVV
jgi:hypothetical protein